MAEDKKGVLVYADWMDKFEALEDDEAGRLIKHFFRYINDLNPEFPDKITKLSFLDIQNTLKRDLAKWEGKKVERSESGIIGNLKRWHLDLYNKYVNGEISLNEALNIADSRKESLSDNSESLTSQTSLLTVSVTDSVSVSDNVKVTVKEKNTKSIDVRKKEFSATLSPFLSEFGKELLNEFYFYWIEPNKSKTKLKFELERTWDVKRRLNTWAKNDKNFNKKTNNGNSKTESRAELAELATRILTGN